MPFLLLCNTCNFNVGYNIIYGVHGMCLKKEGNELYFCEIMYSVCVTDLLIYLQLFF